MSYLLVRMSDGSRVAMNQERIVFPVEKGMVIPS